MRAAVQARAAFAAERRCARGAGGARQRSTRSAGGGARGGAQREALYAAGAAALCQRHDDITPSEHAPITRSRRPEDALSTERPSLILLISLPISLTIIVVITSTATTFDIAALPRQSLRHAYYIYYM